MTLEQDLRALIKDWERFEGQSWKVESVLNGLRDLLKPPEWQASHLADAAMDREEVMTT